MTDAEMSQPIRKLGGVRFGTLSFEQFESVR